MRQYKNKQHTAIVEKEGDGYVSWCSEVDVASQGNTVDDARKNLNEALKLFFEVASDKEIEDRFHV
ncbi:type II toxin-antitoxin system HicB family antitoxin [candidate division KSB1 bacterium]|nr:type II toxin-antitoxin system HicB family antitoxin [candidate division KSB1 bacterium]